MNVAQETLGFRRGGLSPPLSLLMSAFALPMPPEDLPIPLHRPTERSPTTRAIPLIHCPPNRPVTGSTRLGGKRPRLGTRAPLAHRRAIQPRTKLAPPKGLPRPRFSSAGGSMD